MNKEIIEDMPVEQELNDSGKIDRAFIDSDVREFDGVKLFPYTPERIFAAQAIGLHYGRVDEAGKEMFKRKELYPGAQSDVIHLLWLCSLPPDEVRFARLNIPSAEAKAAQWAVQHDLVDMGSDNFQRAYLMFWEIMIAINKSETIPKKKVSLSEANP